MNDIASVMRHRGEFARAMQNNRFEISPDGILFPQQGVRFGGMFDLEHRRHEPSTLRDAGRMAARLPMIGRHIRRRLNAGGDVIARFISPNIIPTEGLNYLLAAGVAGGTVVNPFYVGLFEGNVTPGASLTHATLVATLTECTAYDETTRVAYVEGAVSAGSVDNGSSRAEFTMNATKTIYGGFLASSSTKSTTAAGTCLAAAKFSASRAVVAGDVLAVKYTLSATSS